MLVLRVRARRIAAISYRKAVKDLWPESEFEDIDVPAPGGGSTRMKLASRQTVLSSGDASTKSWPSNYVAALKDLQTKLQKEGNLDGWSNVKSELDRFDADPKIPDGNLSSVAGLQMIQAKFRELPAQVALDKNRKIVALSQKHIAKLTAWQTDLTAPVHRCCIATVCGAASRLDRWRRKILE